MCKDRAIFCRLLSRRERRKKSYIRGAKGDTRFHFGPQSNWIPILGLAALLTTVSLASGQTTPYIGYVYPAGGQQGTTVEVRLGGQRIDGLHSALVSGKGVSAEVADIDDRGTDDCQRFRSTRGGAQNRQAQREEKYSDYSRGGHGAS